MVCEMRSATGCGLKIWKRMKGKTNNLFGFILVMVIASEGVRGQTLHRSRPRPSNFSPSTPGLESYRLRWMEYLKARTSTTVSPLRNPLRPSNRVTPNGNVVVNGFVCERTFSLFPNRNNNRMYHMCARSRDNWYVYHYSCPHGTVFNEGMKKCVQERAEMGAISNVRLRPRLTTTRRPFVVTPIRRVPVMTTTPSQRWTWIPPTPLPETTTTTTGHSLPEPETGVTEPGNWPSDESFSSEEENVKNVVVTIPGFSASSPSVPSSDEAEQVTAVETESSEELNIIPESVNGSNRLPEQKREEQEKTPPKKKTGGDNGIPAGGRRPKILNLWRSIFNKY